MKNEKPNEEIDTYGYRKDFRTAFPQILAVTVKNLILLTFGTTVGFPTILLPAIRSGGNDKLLQLTDSQLSWISSVGYISIPLGCIFSGALTTLIGRKKAMMVVNIPFICAWCFFYFSTQPGHLYISLALSGIAGGLMEAPVLTYVAEITQPHLRGILSATSTMFVIVGVSSQFLLGIFYNWRTVALINIILPVIAIICLFFVPESPFWLLLKSKDAESKRSLAWLRGWTSLSRVENEYKDLLALVEKHKDCPDMSYVEKVKSNLRHFTKKTFYYPYFLTCLAFFMGHFCGMTTLQTYSVLIFETLHVPIDKYYATLTLGIAQILGTIICVSLIHFTGKRPLVFFSTIGVALCFIIAGIYAYCIELKTNRLITTLTISHGNSTTMDHKLGSQDWIPLTFLVGSALISHLGIRLLPWILIGEVFSPETRSTAAGFAGGLGYIFGFLSNMTFLKLVGLLTLPGTFWLYSCVSLLGSSILFWLLPETEGYTLHAINKHFSGEIKLPNKVNRDWGENKKELNNAELGSRNNPMKVSDETDYNYSSTISKL